MNVHVSEETILQSGAKTNLRADSVRRETVLQTLDDLRHIVAHQVLTLKVKKSVNR